MNEPGDVKSGEKLLVFGFLILTLLVPILFQELYPFSAATMFARVPESYVTYSVTNSLEEPIPASSVGLGLNQPHDPPISRSGRQGYGRRFEESPSDFNREFDAGLVRKRALDYLNNTATAFVVVTGHKFGVEDGQVRETDSVEWKILNPKFYK